MSDVITNKIDDDDPFCVDQFENKKNLSFFLDQSAIDRLKEMDDAKHKKLRIEVRGGGCSGYQYFFDFVDHTNANDHTVKEDNIEVVIDQESLKFLDGGSLIYMKSLMGQYFSIKNPNASSSCGCGTSFSV